LKFHWTIWPLAEAAPARTTAATRRRFISNSPLNGCLQKLSSVTGGVIMP
jgi:hypothetical protein